MWNIQLPIIGVDVYRIAFCFVVYSMGGWLLESIYMSICNKKLTNRGFGFLPFCPIYGFGATVCFYLLKPFAGSKLAVYLIGATLATLFEYAVGLLMRRMFGEVWWDYSKKPCNYKGIICLESTLAWGVYALGVVYFLHVRVLGLSYMVGRRGGILFCKIVLLLYLVDFVYHLLEALGVNVSQYRDNVIERCRRFRTRF